MPHSIWSVEARSVRQLENVCMYMLNGDFYLHKCDDYEIESSEYLRVGTSKYISVHQVLFVCYR